MREGQFFSYSIGPRRWRRSSTKAIRNDSRRPPGCQASARACGPEGLLYGCKQSPALRSLRAFGQPLPAALRPCGGLCQGLLLSLLVRRVLGKGRIAVCRARILDQRMRAILANQPSQHLRTLGWHCIWQRSGTMKE
jgi:hypothetical protein